MQVIEDFILNDISVSCPECRFRFATPNIEQMPALTWQSPVETDLHRILPAPALRAAFMALCPACRFAWWINSFTQDIMIDPQSLPRAADVLPSKIFGFAVLTGRRQGRALIDLAVVSLNGLWAAREEAACGFGTEAECLRWLKLAAYQIDQALTAPNWQGNSQRYNYIMGEVLRQMGDFQAAISRYQSIDRRSMLPKELIHHQIALAVAGNAQATLLPPHLVEEIFCLRRDNLDEQTAELSTTRDSQESQEFEQSTVSLAPQALAS